jgi:uncharacterized surface protein with fasciclin (FAS1) repeats
MNRIKNIAFLALIFAMYVGLAGCQKVDGDYTANNKSTEIYNGSVYEYLKSRPGEFDSLLAVIERVGLADTLKNEQNITLFAVKNESFQQVVGRYNLARSVRGKKPIYLKDRPVEFLDSVISRYIIKGAYVADDFKFNDGLPITSVKWNYPMSAKLVTGNSSGLIKGGPASVEFSFTNRSSYTFNWVKASTVAINISAKNGIIHILEPLHPFGFGEYSKAVSEPYDGSIFRGVGIEGPWILPSEVGNTTLIEAEDFDFGGQNIGSYDTPNNNGGKNYRPSELIDIDALKAGKADIGWSLKGEWVNYTVYAPVDGYYVIYSRVGNGSAVNPLQFHWDLDLKNVTGIQTFTKLSGGWHDWTPVISPEIFISKGNHVLRFYWDTNDIQFNNFSVKLNRLK